MPDWFQIILDHARAEAVNLQHPYIRSEHLLLALLKTKPIALSISYDALHAAIANVPKPSCGAQQKLTLANSAQRAVNQARDTGNALTPQHFAQMIVAASPMLQRILNQLTEEA